MFPHSPTPDTPNELIEEMIEETPDGDILAGVDESLTAAPAESLSEEDESFNGNVLPPEADKELLPIVGIGGSAGSIRALQHFFSAMPPDSGLAFVVVVHLARDYESHLSQVLQNHTAMPVNLVTEAIKVEANHVYVIPPGYHLLMRDGKIELSPLQPQFGRRVAVDLFFRSLAASRRSRAVAVVLSGLDSDGAIGIKRIKEHGGVTIAQDPAEAEYEGMPRSAIQTNMVDWVLPVREIAARLIELSQNERRIQLPPSQRDFRQGSTDLEGDEGSRTDEEALHEILSFLAARTRHDFTHYKRATVLRRIMRRLQVNSLSNLQDYLSFLRTHSGESGALLQDLLISVTNFFRDPEAFEALAAHIPLLFREKKTGDQVRVWVPGCATGEEAYSLAMLLVEYAETLPSPPSIQIFATDIDAEATRLAREGRYPQSIAADVSPERLRRFFMLDQGSFRMRGELRELVLFASHNLLRDSPFSRLDFISCRNLLIYFQKEAQENVFNVFHFALRPGGLLFLGSAESVDESSSLFRALDKKQRLYARSSNNSRPSALSALALPTPSSSFEILIPPASGMENFAAPPTRLANSATYGDLHLQLLEQYAPPSLLVDDKAEILHLSPRAGRFLRFTGGAASTNLFNVAHPDLRPELRAALFRAGQSGENVDVPGLPVEIEGQRRNINLHVRPLQSGPNLSGPVNLLLVIFDDHPADDSLEDAPNTVLQRGENESVVRRLEGELQHMRGHLRATIEQYEATTEELKASNEELQAINEELRSAGEELETAKEELQASNEELLTVNQEMKSKVDQLSRANSDLQNLMSSTSIATVFLDRRLRIKRYTPPAIALFNFIPTDRGRPLSDLRLRLNYEGLTRDAEQVLSDLTPIEREVGSNDGQLFLMRVQPYRTIEDRINGVVLTFVDITERKRTEEALRQSEARLRLVLESIFDYAIITLNADGVITGWNPGAVITFGYSPEEAIGQRTDLIFTPEDRAAGIPQQEIQTARAKGRAGDERWHIRKDGTRFYVSGVLSPLCIGEMIIGFVKVARDLTDQRHTADALQNSEARFRTLSDAIPQIIWANDAAGNAVYFNQRWFDYSGLSLELSVGPGWQAIVHPEDAAPSRERWQQALETGEVFDTEYRLRRADAVYRWFIGRNVPLRDTSGRITGWFGTATDVQDLKDAQEALRLSHEELETRVEERTSELAKRNSELRRAEKERLRLLRQLVNAEEAERRRIARELHDHMGQQIAALLLGLKAIQDVSHGRTQALERIIKMQGIVENLDQEVDRLSLELRPATLDDLGLAVALEQHLADWSNQTNVPVSLNIRGLEERLPLEIETTLYRVIQEAMTNIIKHAAATTVSVVIERRRNEVRAVIEDDGQGFDLKTIQRRPDNQRNIGLSSMRERVSLWGGKFNIESAPGKGTSIFVRMPLEELDDAA